MDKVGGSYLSRPHGLGAAVALLAFQIALGVGGVAQAGAAISASRPAVTSLAADPVVVGAGGGVVTVRATTTGSSTCIFSGTGIASLKLPCSGNGAYEKITLAANSTPVAQIWTVYLITKGPGGTSRWRHISITQNPAAATPSTTTSSGTTPSATTSGGTTTTTASTGINPVSVADSTDWSGYVESGGPFTAVRGTFTVPNLIAASSETDTSEWVGIDGSAQSGGALIQAGVQERYEPTSNLVQLSAWWEILPAASVVIPMTIQTGDQVTVLIGQVSPGLWLISVTDNTNGQNFTVERDYIGPGASAEWVVEAPTNPDGIQDTLGDYTPSVTFTNLGITRTQSTLTQELLTQNNSVVSSPSTVANNGFTVAYGSTQPPPP